MYNKHKWKQTNMNESKQNMNKNKQTWMNQKTNKQT